MTSEQPDTSNSPTNSIDLVMAILRLDSLAPMERARAAAALIQPAQQVLATIRREAIFEATRTLSYREVAESLGVKEATINVAVSDHGRTERPTHQYGRFLAVVRAAAVLAAEIADGGTVERYQTLERTAMATPTAYGTVIKEVGRWLEVIERHDQAAAAAMRSRVRMAEVPILHWVTATQRHLNLAERSEVMHGYSATLTAQQGGTGATR